MTCTGHGRRAEIWHDLFRRNSLSRKVESPSIDSAFMECSSSMRASSGGKTILSPLYFLTGEGFTDSSPSFDIQVTLSPELRLSLTAELVQNPLMVSPRQDIDILLPACDSSAIEDSHPAC